MEELAADDPRTLGRYRVVARLGAGGMGRVLLGVDAADRRAALTLVHPDLAADPGFRERFRREVQMAATAPPWFTAPVLDADPDAERPWLATAYVEGPSLQAYVREHGPLGRQGTVALAIRMADGLVALQGAGLVHRDLKPSNVLLAEDGPRLIDFGISRAADTASLAQAGHVMGTPAFMSPEQVAGTRDVGPASDVFSFGSLIGFAATGWSPFAANAPAEALYRVATADPQLGPIDGRLREVVLACLSKDPAARPTAAQVRDQLRALDQPDPAAAPTVAAPAVAPHPGPPAPPAVVGPPVLHQPGPDPSRKRWGVIAAIVAAAVAGAAVALVAVLLLSRDDAATEPVAAAPGPATTSGSAPSASASAGGTADPAAGATVIDAENDGRFGTGTARFATPSRNIACQMSSGEVRCDVLERTWQLPPKPADCAQDYGAGAVLVGAQEGELSCVSDTVADPSLPVLSYGQGVRFEGVLCVSRETGMRCADERTGHGFAVARASYEVF